MIYQNRGVRRTIFSSKSWQQMWVTDTDKSKWKSNAWQMWMGWSAFAVKSAERISSVCVCVCVCVCVYELDTGKRSSSSLTNQSNQIPAPFIALAVFPSDFPACWSRNKFLWLNHIKFMYLEIRSHTCDLQIYFNPLHDGNDDIYHSHLWGTPTWWVYSENRAFWVTSSVLGDQ